MSRRKKRITTKNTHGGLTKQKVSNSIEMKNLEAEQMENIKGQKIGLNFAIKIPGYEKPFTGAGVYKLEGFNQLHARFLKNINETKINSNFDCSDITATQILIYQYMKHYIDKNSDDEGVKCDEDFTQQVIEFCMSYSMFVDSVQEKIKDNYNKYITLELCYSDHIDNERKEVSSEWEIHPSFEDFSSRGEELIQAINPDYSHVSVMYNTDKENINEEDVDMDFDDEPVDYTIDDIQIVDDAVVPIMGVQYEVLLKLKNSMTILEIGQTIKIPKDERLRSTIYQLNKKYFPTKRFSVVQSDENFIVFLNPERKDRINRL